LYLFVRILVEDSDVTEVGVVSEYEVEVCSEVEVISVVEFISEFEFIDEVFAPEVSAGFVGNLESGVRKPLLTLVCHVTFFVSKYLCICANL